MENNSSGKTILLVEADKALNRAVTFKLQQKGHTVISTLSSEEAFEALRSKPDIDLIWLDILLPGMNGIDFLTELRTRPDGKNKKVVICSVSGGAESKEVAMNLGVVDYLVKSDYDLNNLVETVVGYV